MGNNDVVLMQRDNDIVTLTMNRPPANALNNVLTAALLEEVRELARESCPPGIVLTGQGDRFFSAGGDIKEVAGLEVSVPRLKLFHAFLCEMEKYPAPIVCAVRGYAVGGALEFLLHADYVVANHGSKFGFPEINHGLLPAAKGMRQAVQRLGLRQAQMLLYWGDLIDGQKALEMEIINEIRETADVIGRASEVCRHLRAKEPRLFAAIKRSMNFSGLMDNDALEAMTIDDLGAYLTGDDSANARARFLSKNEKKA